MDLSKEDVIELLNISEESLNRLILQGEIPVYTLDQTLRFNREEIEGWLMETAKKHIMGETHFDSHHHANSPWIQYALYRALHKGLVLETDLTDKESIFADILAQAANHLSLDFETIKRHFLEREKLMPTSLGSGIGIPHTREFLLEGLFDAIFVVFLTHPISWGGLDQEPVHTLFFLFSCDDKRHLSLLAKIAHLASKEENLQALRSKPDKKKLMNFVKDWEASLLMTCV